MSGMLSSVDVVLSQNTPQLHAETPVGLAEGKGAPPLALVSSVSGFLLALEQLVVQRET